MVASMISAGRARFAASTSTSTMIAGVAGAIPAPPRLPLWPRRVIEHVESSRRPESEAGVRRIEFDQDHLSGPEAGPDGGAVMKVGRLVDGGAPGWR
jgi:hypothetical protein